jgi:predicted kinase
MEAVVLCGVQGSGKTTLYRHRFLNSHVHVSLDVVRSRAREAELLRACLDERRPFVVDNTNPTPADRRRYIEPARAAGFTVIGYLVEASAGEAFARADIPPARVAATARALQTPTLEEGFDELWHATAAPEGGWRIEPLLTTPPLF